MDSTYARGVSIRSREAAALPAGAAPPSSAVSFESSTHCYRFHGRRLISVTPSHPGSGADPFGVFTETARQRGRAVHLAVHFDAEGDLEGTATASP
jgi:hypothetical protein